jgi:hypothetical protein
MVILFYFILFSLCEERIISVHILFPFKTSEFYTVVISVFAN